MIWGYFVAQIFHFYTFTKHLWKQFNWFSSNFKLFCHLDFPFLYINKNFLKNLWKQFNWFLSNFKVFCDSGFPFLYILERFLKILGTKIIVFKTIWVTFWVISNDFVARICPSYIVTNVFWKIYENKKYCI